MREHIEKVPQRIGSSWRYKKILEDEKSFDWHRHEEYEIAIHRNFNGMCLVGNNSSNISHNHMVLLAPGIPHAFCCDKSSQKQRCETLVIWFKKPWIESLINCCSELKPLHSLLIEAQKGIQFSTQNTEKVALLLDNLQSRTSVEQLAILMQIFSVLIAEQQKTSLILNNIIENDAQEQLDHKLKKAELFLLENFHQEVKQSQIAEHLYISESSVRRLFYKHFKESFSQHLMKIRLNVACDLLINTQLPINIIMEKVGYFNQANFNRQFKNYKHVTPNGYRSAMKLLDSGK